MTNAFPNLRELTRPSSPNSAFAAPEACSTVAEVDLKAPVFALPATELFGVALALWSVEPRVTCVYSDVDALRAAFIAKTAVFRFKDDIYVEFVPIGTDQSSVIMYSKSRVGYSDLGVNRKRVDQWLNVLRQHVENS